MDKAHIAVGFVAGAIMAATSLVFPAVLIPAWLAFCGWALGWEMADQEWKWSADGHPSRNHPRAIVDWAPRMLTNRLPMWPWKREHVLDLLSYWIGVTVPVAVAVVWRLV